MFRRSLTLCLAIALTQIATAQSATEPSSTKPPLVDPFQVQPPPPVRFLAYTNYDVLRQGTEMKVAVALIRHWDSHTVSPPQFVLSARSLVPESVSTCLELDPAPEFSLSALQPPHAKATRFSFAKQSIKVLVPTHRGRPVVYRVKVSAAESVAPGPYVLRGRFTYREADDQGISNLHIVPIEIPIRVVDHNASAKKDKYWTFDQSRAKETTALVLLAPVLIPLGAVAGVVCLIAWGDCTD
jgi:hypothetical protein